MSRSRFTLLLLLPLVLFDAPANANAPAGRYTVTADTVVDSRTELTWQRATGPASSWEDAGSYCEGLSLNGTGWRLPTVKELLTLVDHSRTDPAIDTTAFPDTESGWYWSSTPRASGSTEAWHVRFEWGDAWPESRVSDGFVRCVR